MSVWNPDNIKDIAESVGITSLNEDVLHGLCSDIEYRLSQVLEEALKFMRHGKRGTLSTQDISLALRTLDVEPLYGYESTRSLRFGEASIGPGQPLFYVEDEEVDFEKLINAPLPKVPREISLTAHWLAIEGVQPSIPQNPTTADSRNQELVPKGPGVNPNLAAISGTDSVSVKPQVKHILSKEIQLYFENVCSYLLDENSRENQIAALDSIKSDPGLHQLVPYFVQFIAEKVTHNLTNLFVLEQMIHLTSSMLQNETLYVDSYIPSLIPPILTCLVGRHLGPPTSPLAHYPLRTKAASLLGDIAQQYSKSSHTLRPRLARTCLKHFLDPTKPLGTIYGGVLGLQKIGGPEVVRVLVVPNLKEFEVVMGGDEGVGGEDEVRNKEREILLEALVDCVCLLEEERNGVSVATNGNGNANGNSGGEELATRLKDKIGDLVANKVLALGRPGLVKTVLEC